MRPIATALILIAVSGCGLSQRQREDIARWEVESVELGHPEVKYRNDVDPQRAIGYGFLPFGIGGFYVHRPGLGVSGILFWPLSITWLPAVAGSSAYQYNYQEFRNQMISLRQEAQARPKPPAGPSTDVGLDELNRLRTAGKITDAEYQDLRRRLLERVGQQ